MERRLIVTVLLLLSCGLAQGEIYKWVDKTGRVHYSDARESKDSEKIQLSKPSVYSSPASQSSVSKGATTEKKKLTQYTNFAITYPANKSVVRNLDEGLIITFTASPGLFKGNYIQLIVDGRILPAKITSLSHSLGDLDRGTHFLQSSIMDKDGRLKKRASVVQFHVRKEVVKDQASTPTTPGIGDSGNKNVDAPQFTPGQSSDFSGQPSTPGQDSSNFKPGAGTGYAPNSSSHTPGQTNPSFKPN